MLKVYTYSGCNTCRQAVKYLQAAKIAFQEVPIRETPPSRKELRAMHEARGRNWRKLFNTSGADYKALGLAKKLPTLNESEVLELLAGNGNLVKRPFVIGDHIHLTGFKVDEWERAISDCGARIAD